MGHKSYRFAAKINLRALFQTSHVVVHTCKRTTCVTTVKFLLVSDLASTTDVPSVLAVPSPTGQTGRRPFPVCLAVPSVPSCFRLTCIAVVQSVQWTRASDLQRASTLKEKFKTNKITWKCVWTVRRKFAAYILPAGCIVFITIIITIYSLCAVLLWCVLY